MKKRTLAIGTLTLTAALAVSISGIALAAQISKDRAEEIALSDAGVKEDDLIYIYSKQDRDDGRLVYDVEFVTDDYIEYDYEISVSTGEILGMDYDAEYIDYDRYEKEPERKRDRTHKSDRSVNNSSADIGKEKAEEIALEKAGLRASEADYIKIKKDYDDGRYTYEGEIYAGSYEYEFEICAETGRVLEFERDSIYD